MIVNPDNLGHVEASLLLTSYCLDTNLERMMELWAAIFEDLHLNNIDREEGDSDFSLFIAGLGNGYFSKSGSNLPLI